MSETEGVTHVFGVIGTVCIDITDAIYRTPGMPLYSDFSLTTGTAYVADGMLESLRNQRLV